MPLSERVYCVTIAFKTMSELSNKSASDFALSLNIPPRKLFGWFRRLQLWAAGDWQLHHDSAPAYASCVVFWWNIKSPTWLSPPTAQFGPLQLLAFPNTKITFEREEIPDWRDSGKYNEAADGDWENCVRSQGAYFEGDWGIIVLFTVFLVSCIFFSKCLYFSYYMTGHFLDRPHTYTRCTHMYMYIHVYIYYVFHFGPK